MKFNINDFRKLKTSELFKKANDLRGQLFVLNVQITSGKSNKFATVKKIKRQIAQILTIIQENKLSTSAKQES